MAKVDLEDNRAILNGILTHGTGFPVALFVGSASPHEVRLVEETLDKRLIEEKPERSIGDRAYDSVALDERLAKQGIMLIAPHKFNRKKPTLNAYLPGCKTIAVS